MFTIKYSTTLIIQSLATHTQLDGSTTVSTTLTVFSPPPIPDPLS